MKNSIDKLIEVANKEYDGHFTLLKFTTNWRCSFGTVNDTLAASYYMAKGKTMNEAIENCLKDNINSYDIYQQKN